MNSNPSINPADEWSATGAYRFIFNKMMQQINGMLPAKVIKYNGTNRVSVIPLISVLTVDNEAVPRAQIDNLPVFQLGGGGWILRFNLNAGDLGWIVANDRDISQFLQTYKNSIPNTLRTHNFADAVFFPNMMAGFDILSEDSQNTVLQNSNASVRIALWPNKVKITAPTVEINGNLVVDGSITSSGALNVQGGGASITGDVAVVGNITATGNITPNV